MFMKIKLSKDTELPADGMNDKFERLNLLQVSSYELRVASYEFRVEGFPTRYDIRRESRIKSFIFLLFFILLTASLLQAQSALITVEASVDKSTITIGDLIKYSLKIDRAKGLRVKDPGKGTNLGMFEIRDYTIHDSIEVNNRVIQQFDYVISVYDTGKFVIPPFPIAFLPADTSTKYQFITSEPLEIQVRSVVNDENAQIQDIRPPLGIPPEYWRMVLMVGSLVLGLAALAAAYWMYRKRKQGRPFFGKEAVRPAHQIALEELEKLLESDLLQKGQFKMFYSALSDIARRYIERRFFIPAMEETTTELLTSLDSEKMPLDHINLVQDILNACDLVKFAKYVPDASGVENTVRQVREFIEQTKLEFEPAEREIKEEVE